VPAFTNDRRDRFSNVSARVSARYTLNDDDANVYVTYSTGFKSGAYPSLSPTTPVTRPEKIRALEGGLKMPLAQGRILLTAAAFHYNYTDIQLSSLDINTATSSLQNAGKAKVSGAELSVSGKIGSRLTLNSGISWMPEAKYTEYLNAAIVRPNAAGTSLENAFVNLSGTRLVRAPEVTVNLGANYTTPLLGGEASFSANYYYSSRVVLAASGRLAQKPYHTLDLRVAFTPERSPVELSVYATNVTNTYYANGGQSSSAADSFYSARPREIGFGARVRL
jgi:iron complex outermembrane receptor protein